MTLLQKLFPLPGTWQYVNHGVPSATWELQLGVCTASSQTPAGLEKLPTITSL